MSEQYIKAELVTPKWTGTKWVGSVLSGLFMTRAHDKAMARTAVLRKR